MDVCAYQQDNWSGQAPGFFPILNLDYDRVISQWGEGSVFSSNDLSIEEFTTGDFLLDLDGIDELSAFGLFDCEERSQSPAQPALCATPPQLFSAVAPPKLVACCPTTFDSSSSPVYHCFDNWRCAPDLYVKKEPGFSSPFSTSSACLSNSSESCIVPDTVQSSATSAGALPLGNSYGIVPQPSRFMCSMPNPPPTMQAVLPLEPPSELVRLRQECLQRYRDKKARRMYTKMIRYRLRKINADKRPRIKGRFVKKEIQQSASAILGECMAGSDSVQGDECMSDDSL